MCYKETGKSVGDTVGCKLSLRPPESSRFQKCESLSEEEEMWSNGYSEGRR